MGQLCQSDEELSCGYQRSDRGLGIEWGDFVVMRIFTWETPLLLSTFIIYNGR